MKIRVTQEDIDLGTPDKFDSTKCVIARALTRQLPWWRKLGYISVGVDQYSSGVTGYKRLPKNAAELVRDVIGCRPVQPIEFEI